MNEWRYKELQQLGNIDFRFAEKGEAIHAVSRLSNSMQLLPKNILRGHYYFNHYNSELIEEYLPYLRPDNLLLAVSAKGLEVKRRSGSLLRPLVFSHYSEVGVSRPRSWRLV